MVTGSPIIKDIAWTAEVANAKQLTGLVAAAAKGEITHGPRRVGGGTRMYEGVETIGAGAPKATILQAEGGMTAKNTSEAAKTLVRFTDFNCNQQ